MEPLEQEDTTTSDVKITPNTSASEQSEEERCISAGSVRSDNSEHLKAILGRHNKINIFLVDVFY